MMMSFGFAGIVKNPFLSVEVAAPVFFIKTLAPYIGALSIPVTTPVIFCCAEATAHEQTNQSITNIFIRLMLNDDASVVMSKNFFEQQFLLRVFLIYSRYCVRILQVFTSSSSLISISCVTLLCDKF